MPLLVPDLGLLLTAAPGTGSTSLLAFFEQIGPTERVPPMDVVADGVVVLDAKHATITQLVEHGVIERTDLAAVRICTSTRNPFAFWPAEWHRTRTRWLAELRDPASWVHRQSGMVGRIVDAVEQDFDRWLGAALGEHAGAGRTMHLNPGHVVEANVVIRMEHMDEDVATLLGEAMGSGAVPHINQTPTERPYWQWYSATSRALVEQVHAPDLDRFGYRF